MANKLPKNLIGAFHDDPLREDESPLSPSGFNENMPEMDGLTLLSKLGEQNNLLKAVIVSAYLLIVYLKMP